MEKLTGNRALAIFLAMSLALVTFVGLFAIALPPDFTVVVADDSGDMGDKEGYVGDGFLFAVDAQPFIDDWDYNNVSANLTATLTINLSTPLDLDMPFEDMSGDGGSILFMTIWTADVAGTFDFLVYIVDDGNASINVNSTGQIIVHEVVSFNAAFDDTIEIAEDAEAFTWNITDAFLPAGLDYAITWPAEISAVMIEDMVYNITAAEDFNGELTVVINATDDYIGYFEHNFTITVSAVNDAPVIEHFMIGEDQTDIEIWNYTWVDETDGNMSEFRNVVNLTFDEEGNISFMVSAADIDMDDLTYTLDMGDAPVTIDNLDVNETNVTIPFNFTIIGDEDANGVFWGTMNVSDAELWNEIYVQLTIEAVNDAPTATGDWDAIYDIKTEEEINVSASGTDVDGDDLTFIWKVDGTTVVEMEYFAYNWTAAGTYNVSVEVSDGTETIDIGYFTVNVEVANTAPVISYVTVYPVGLSLLEAIDFISGDVEEGKDVELTCVATDAEGDDLTYTWTNDQDSSWTAAGDVVIVSADDFTMGLSYVFTCTVSDGLEEVSEDTTTINIVEEEDDPPFLEACGIMLAIPIIIIILIIVIIIVIIMKKKGKKDEEIPEETPMEGEMPVEEPGMEGEMPMEGMEQPMPEEAPVEQTYEAPVEEPIAPAPEEPVAPAPEEPVAPPVEEPVAPAPEQPVPPAPEAPVAPQPPAPMPPQ